MIGPEALDDAAWWAVQAAQYARQAEAADGSISQDRLWWKARSAAQVAQAFTGLAQAAADTQQFRSWGTDEWTTWDAVLGGHLPYESRPLAARPPATSARAWHERFCNPGVPFDGCPNADVHPPAEREEPGR